MGRAKVHERVRGADDLLLMRAFWLTEFSDVDQDLQKETERDMVLTAG